MSGFKLDASHVVLFLATFIPAVTKAIQAAAGGGKLDVLTVILIVFPILIGTVNLLKQSPIQPAAPAAPTLAPPAGPSVLGFKKPAKKN